MRGSKHPKTRIAMLLFAGLVSSGFCAGQQDQPPPAAHRPPTGTTRIAGRVVSSTDGHPLAGTSLSLTDTRSRQAVASTTADGEGRFSFSNLPPGKFALNGAQRGYLPASYQQHEQFSTAIVTGTGIPTDALTLELTPFALISGRVLDEAGDPVRQAIVSLYRETHGTGTARIEQVGGSGTDDLGAYELTHLGPGSYLLSVQAQPWYAFHRHTQSQGPYTGTVDPALDVVYPLTFYPGTTNSDQASPILLKGGEQLPIDFRLTPVPALTLTLPPPQGSGAMPHLEQEVFSSTRMAMSETEGTETGITLYGIAPGRYRLVQPESGTGRPASVSTVDLSAGSIALSGTGGTLSTTVAITVHDNSGAALPPDTRVAIRRIGSSRLDQQGISGKGQVEFSGIQPGQYRIDAYINRRVCRSVRTVLNGKVIPGNSLEIGPGAKLNVDITVTASSAVVEGFAKRDAGGSGGSMIVLVPAGADHDTELFRRDQSDLDGSFVLPEVFPGNYILVAIDDGWKLDWGRLEVLTPYLSKGVPVTISGTTATLHLAEPVAVQPR